MPQLASGNGASRPRVARPYKRSTKSRRSLTRGRDGGGGVKVLPCQARGTRESLPQRVGGFCLRPPGPCLGPGRKILQRCPGLSVVRLRESSQARARSPGSLALPPASPSRTPVLADGTGADLVLIEEGRVHVDVLHRAIVPLELHHRLLQPAVARGRGGEEQMSTPRGRHVGSGAGGSSVWALPIDV